MCSPHHHNSIDAAPLSPSKTVSFVADDQVITIDRIKLSFYKPRDFLRFAAEEKAVDEKSTYSGIATTVAKLDQKYTVMERQQAKAKLAEKRRRGYQMMQRRRAQRIAPH
ncbi:expressed unknown protein [Seminavis robusta]|uniref:Uncharacterized protein n=1 Tax=Seminavis robusta TaxID=568900 RepID=A0A9N8HGD9_9STRA|nr:expressed unknown protein [Seminavis robusta]|eukprot:Sro480_g151300.1 n/a (110) ;mRNA; r:10823-11152